MDLLLFVYWSKRINRRWRWNYREAGEGQKFRVQPFLKGWQEWRGQSPFPGGRFPYFRSGPQLLYPKRSVRSTQKII